MSINLRTYQSYRIVDFSGGLNEFDRSFTFENNELQEATNVELRSGGSIAVRLGSPVYQRQAFLSITSPVTNLFHYGKFNGERKVLAYSGGTVYSDDDNGEFTSVLAVTSDDGHCRFTQWREAALFGTASSAVYAYDPAHTATIPVGATPVPTPGIARIDLSGNASVDPLAWVAFTPVVDAAGVLTPLATYGYRATVDLYCADTFLGESGVANVFNPSLGVIQLWYSTAVTLGAADTAVEIRLQLRLGTQTPYEMDFFYGARVGAINIYRTITPLPLSNRIETNMVYVGSIPRSLFGDTATVQIKDQGLYAGRSIAPFYSRAVPPARGRFIAVHKSRLWTAHVQYPTPPPNGPLLFPGYDGYVFLKAQHRVYFSEINEIGAQIPTSWVEIDPTDGDGITGIISYKNKILIVFQANSIWAISGGDDEVVPGIPDISVENISTDVGCVAPESIQICEGRVVFLSHRGLYYYDGTFPKPLKTENIDRTILDLRPLAKYDDPASIFLAKEREYWISHASTDANSSYNTLISKFSFKNNSWVRGDYGTRGFASFIEKRDTFRPPLVLGGIEASSSDMSAETAIRRMDVAGYDGVSTAISWGFRTKFFDMGNPHMDKKYVAVLVQLESETDVTLQVSCDNHLLDEPFTILNTENDQDFDLDEMIWANDAGTIGSNWSDGVTGAEWAGENQRNALIYLNTKCWGKRISFRFSGSSSASAPEIQALTVFYDSKEGVRQ